MKILEVISKWQKPGTKWVEIRADEWRKEPTGLRNMAMCKVQLDNGAIVTRHLVIP